MENYFEDAAATALDDELLGPDIVDGLLGKKLSHLQLMSGLFGEEEQRPTPFFPPLLRKTSSTPFQMAERSPLLV